MAQWEYLELLVTRQAWLSSEGHSGKLPQVDLGDEVAWASVAPILNQLGAQGWELVSTVLGESAHVDRLFLKRPVS